MCCKTTPCKTPISSPPPSYLAVNVAGYLYSFLTTILKVRKMFGFIRSQDNGPSYKSLASGWKNEPAASAEWQQEKQPMSGFRWHIAIGILLTMNLFLASLLVAQHFPDRQALDKPKQILYCKGLHTSKPTPSSLITLLFNSACPGCC